MFAWRSSDTGEIGGDRGTCSRRPTSRSLTTTNPLDVAFHNSFYDGNASIKPGYELYPAPQSWAEQAYPKLIHYNKLPKGGHFAAWEQPQLFSEEARAGFRSLRS
jgi:hypothetical protein